MRCYGEVAVIGVNGPVTKTWAKLITRFLPPCAPLTHTEGEGAERELLL